jgi:hypothetical protein
MKLSDIAQVIRSKNAGPRRLTLDVTIIPYAAGRAIKIVMARRMMAGDPGDVDVYGAQQHAPLLGVEL